MPLIHDTYTGFHVAVPDGWGISTLGGEIAVSSTPKGTEAVVLYPALQTSGLTPRAFFDQYLSLKEQSMQAAGTPVSIQPQPDNGGLPVDSFTATEGGVPAAGIATVMQLPLASQLASSMLVYVAYWAPTASFLAEQDRLAAIAACYGPESASLFRVFQDQVFTYAMPPDWNNAGEGRTRSTSSWGPTPMSASC